MPGQIELVRLIVKYPQMAGDQAGKRRKVPFLVRVPGDGLLADGYGFPALPMSADGRGEEYLDHDGEEPLAEHPSGLLCPAERSNRFGDGPCLLL
jgi:hypothetical protein